MFFPARSSWEEHVGMCDNMRKGDFEHSNEESNGNSSDEEENQLSMSSRKGDDENLKEKEKNINEVEDTGRRKCRTKILIDKYNKEVRGWTYSSNKPELPPGNKKTKEENRLENSKRKKIEPPLNGMIYICWPS